MIQLDFFITEPTKLILGEWYDNPLVDTLKIDGAYLKDFIFPPGVNRTDEVKFYLRGFTDEVYTASAARLRWTSHPFTSPARPCLSDITKFQIIKRGKE